MAMLQSLHISPAVSLISTYFPCFAFVHDVSDSGCHLQFQFLSDFFFSNSLLFECLLTTVPYLYVVAFSGTITRHLIFTANGHSMWTIRPTMPLALFVRFL